MLVGKISQHYIFALLPLDSCHTTVYKLHIFCGKRQHFGSMNIQPSQKEIEYPQTHNLWITFAVDVQTSAISAFWAQRQKDIPYLSTQNHLSSPKNKKMHNIA